MQKPGDQSRKTVMRHVYRHGILGPKGLLTPGSVLSALLIGGIVVLLAGQSAYTQVGQETNKVLVGAAAFGDWHNDAPGVRRLITAQDLPGITKDGPDFAEILPRPPEAMPRVPEGFSVDLVTSGLAQARVIWIAPNGDLFVTNSSANEVRVYRIPPGSSKPAVEWVQDLQSFFWSEAEVNAKLESVMRRAFTEVHESARKHRTHMRTGAYCLAVGRVADATLVRGLFP
jgi:hypothetical protein